MNRKIERSKNRKIINSNQGEEILRWKKGSGRSSTPLRNYLLVMLVSSVTVSEITAPISPFFFLINYYLYALIFNSIFDLIL